MPTMFSTAMSGSELQEEIFWEHDFSTTVRDDKVQCVTSHSVSLNHPMT